MKTKNVIICTLMLFVASFWYGCGPAKVEPIEEIDTNESAFVIPLEGESKNKQKQFESIKFLDEKKVASKRIVMPIRKRSTGRMFWEYEWLPTIRVVTVDRSPITREWTSDAEKAANSTAAVEVESKDSIGFLVGANISAFVHEEDTATFLYYYRSQPLSKIIDTNVRGVIQAQLSEQFGQYNLQECKEKKNEIFSAVRAYIIEHFKQYGITISSFGLAEGLTYVDKEIQDAINDAYVAEMNIVRARQDKEAQIEINEKNLSIAINERAMAEEFAKAAEARAAQVAVDVEMMKAQALLNFSEKWDGSSLPKFISSGGQSSPFLFQLQAE